MSASIPSFSCKRGKSDARRAAWGENVDFICWYLFHNPGAKYTHVLKALCEYHNIDYRDGQYSNYFNGGFGGNPATYRLWQKVDGGWMLSIRGMERYGDWCV